jgi:[ribosomal protein S5]-alanine N-acetyltransferase
MSPAVTLLPIDAGLPSALDGLSLGDHAALIDRLIEQTMSHFGPEPRPAPWLAYLAADPARGVVVGTCAFKNLPDATRDAEIAYFTFPEYEGKGYATAMASALIALARDAAPDVRVIAHTLPEVNASGSVLGKVGMRRAGEVIDPEDGLVWRWEHAPR